MKKKLQKTDLCTGIIHIMEIIVEKTKELYQQLSLWLKSVNANMASHDSEYNAEKDSLMNIWIRTETTTKLRKTA